MPIFVYKCVRCDKTHEILEWKASHPYGRQCPDCGDFLERQPSAPNFAVNGYNAKNGYAKESR